MVKGCRNSGSNDALKGIGGGGVIGVGIGVQKVAQRGRGRRGAKKFGMMEHRVQVGDRWFGVSWRKIHGLKWSGNGKGQI